MSQTFEQPDWIPRPIPGARVLVAGASGGIGRAVVAMLAAGGAGIVGAHGRRAVDWEYETVRPFVSELRTEADCRALIDSFVKTAGGIDGLVVLVGGVAEPVAWEDLSADGWSADLDLNLSVPFFLARAAFERMKAGGGRIVLNGTESALHGGGRDSLAYGIAKRGTECLVQGFARDGAPYGILVNGVRLGFVASGFHERWQGKDGAALDKRAAMVPLGRAGTPEEAAALIVYLLSGWGGFITGQMLPLTGGDWL